MTKTQSDKLDPAIIMANKEGRRYDGIIDAWSIKQGNKIEATVLR